MLLSIRGYLSFVSKTYLENRGCGGFLFLQDAVIGVLFEYLGEGMNAKGTTNNLNPCTTPEEAKQLGANGGRKSGEVRRKKRDARKVIEDMLYSNVMNPDIKQNMEALFGKENSDTYINCIIAAQIQKAMNSDTKAFNALFDHLPPVVEDDDTEAADDIAAIADALVKRKIQGIDTEDGE